MTLRSGRGVLDEAMERFNRAHEDYHQILQTVEERQMSIISAYQDFKGRISRYLEISRRVSTPTARSGEHLTDTVSHVDPRVAEELQVVGSQEEDQIQPHDSVSQVELRSNGKQRPRASQSRSGSGTASVSRASQRSVRPISVADERIRLAAEKAAMIFEASLLSEQDSLAQERLRLEQQERLLKLKTEIAKTEAKEKSYEDFEVIDDDIPVESVRRLVNRVLRSSLPSVYTTFIMADRSGGVVTNCIRARQVRSLSPNPRSGRVEKYSKFVRAVKFCSLVFVSSA